MLQAALNGDRTRADHPAVPLTPAELAADAEACGTPEFHVHPRDADGRETLEAEHVDAAVRAIRERVGQGTLVGVSTGAWILPDLDARLAAIATWTEPNYASVNVSEPGFDQVMRALLDRGIGIEAGVWTVEEAHRLAASGLADAVSRVLIEPVTPTEDTALDLVYAIHTTLDDAGITAPRLQHADGPATWLVIEDAIEQGLDTRIGLEDVLHLRDGRPTIGNAKLVAQANALGAIEDPYRTVTVFGRDGDPRVTMERMAGHAVAANDRRGRRHEGTPAAVIAAVLERPADDPWTVAAAAALTREWQTTGSGRLFVWVGLGEGRMFHVTAQGNRASIQEYGLDWRRRVVPHGIAGSLTSEWPGIFLCDEGSVDFFAQMSRVPYDVWAVDVTGLWLEGDPGADGGGGDAWVIACAPIPPERLRIARPR
jgi:uncharacterized protein (DUF849 family)